MFYHDKAIDTNECSFKLTNEKYTYSSYYYLEWKENK